MFGRRRISRFPLKENHRTNCKPPISGEQPISIKTETQIIKRVLKYRPGDQLPETLVAQMPAPDYDEGDILRIGSFWPGPVIELSSYNIIEQIQFGMPKLNVMIDGMQCGITTTALKTIFPDLKVTAERRSPPPDNNVIFRRYAATSKKGWIIEAAGHDEDHVQAFYLSRPGYNDKLQNLLQARADERAENAARAEAKLRLAADALNNKRVPKPAADAALKKWAAENHHRGSLVHRLMTARPVDWIDFLWGDINWDNGLAPLIWIIRQPLAPIAVLFEIFYLSEPDFYCSPENKNPGYVAEEFAMLDEIKDRLNSGFYISKIPFDGETAWDNRCSEIDSPDLTPWRQAFRKKFPTNTAADTR